MPINNIKTKLKIMPKGNVGSTPALAAFVIRNLPPPPAKILEVGCCQGALAEILVREGYSVVGVDIDEIVIGHAQSRCSSYTKIGFEWLNFGNLDERSCKLKKYGKFDAMVSIFSFHHLIFDKLSLHLNDVLHDMSKVIIVDLYVRSNKHIIGYVMEVTIRICNGWLNREWRCLSMSVKNYMQMCKYRVGYLVTVKGLKHLLADIRMGLPPKKDQWQLISREIGCSIQKLTSGIVILMN